MIKLQNNWAIQLFIIYSISLKLLEIKENGLHISSQQVKRYIA